MALDIILIIFPVMMIFAAFSDILTFTIPNRVPVILLMGYAIAAVYFEFSPERMIQDLLCGIMILIVGAALFAMKLIGGGDAKLAAATAVWVGWENLLSYGLVASLVGFVLTIMIILLHYYNIPQFLRSIRFLERLADKNNGVPYGVALAVGGLVVYPHTKVWSLVVLGS